jgi:hypothetical protein
VFSQEHVAQLAAVIEQIRAAASLQSSRFLFATPPSHIAHSAQYQKKAVRYSLVSVSTLAQVVLTGDTNTSSFFRCHFLDAARPRVYVSGGRDLLAGFA